VKQQELLQRKVLQREPWQSVIATLDYSGRAEALRALRMAVAQCRDAGM
jgi:hypothetical protein